MCETPRAKFIQMIQIQTSSNDYQTSRKICKYVTCCVQILVKRSSCKRLRADLALIRRDDVPQPGEFISRCRGLQKYWLHMITFYHIQGIKGLTRWISSGFCPLPAILIYFQDNFKIMFIHFPGSRRSEKAQKPQLYIPSFMFERGPLLRTRNQLLENTV